MSSTVTQGPGAAEVRAALEAITASPVFRASRRCQQFLQYVCDKALAGEESSLKERAIAVDVFGRKLHTDLGEDTIVRVGAREVRKRLAQYYVSPEGAASALRIGLPAGSYVPEFRYAEAAAPVEAEALPVALPAPVEADLPGSFRRFGPAVLVLVLLMAGTAALLLTRPAASEPSHAFNRFWEPVFASPDPLLLVVGNPIVYHASSRAHRLSEDRLPPQELPLQRPIQVRPEELNGSDLIPVLNQYVGFGDMVVGTEVSSMLARHSKAVRVRLASSVPFADLRQSPSLLIGAITNRWTMELGKDWRFRFTRASELRTVIEDRQASPPKIWRVQASEDGSVPDDYILVSRIVRSSAGGLQIVAAGIKQFGTEAAGHVLTDPVSLSTLLQKLPEGWESKNLQLVLHVKVIGNTPDQPELVAYHVW